MNWFDFLVIVFGIGCIISILAPLLRKEENATWDKLLEWLKSQEEINRKILELTAENQCEHIWLFPMTTENPLGERLQPFALVNSVAGVQEMRIGTLSRQVI